MTQQGKVLPQTPGDLDLITLQKEKTNSPKLPSTLYTNATASMHVYVCMYTHFHNNK